METIIKRMGLFLLGASLLTMSVSAQSHGKVLEGLTMHSEITGYNVNYSVYLPFDYELSERHYPVLYLLHGYTDDETAWVQFGEVNQTVGMAVIQGKIPPMIIVMPDAGVTWYIDNHSGNDNYETMIFEEFIPHVEEQYRIRSKKEFRAVGGLSMGGYGSLVWSLRHPDIFGSCIAYSAGVLTDEEFMARMDKGQNHLDHVFGEPGKKGELPDHWKKYSVLNMVENMTKEEIERVRFYIDCGDDDFLYSGNSLLHIAFRNKEVQHEYRVRDGAHNWSYWRENLIYGLEFISKEFHR